MRATGNLAGVEFLAPPAYHPQDKEWREVITESGFFFTKSAARFFSSRIYWDTLTATPSGYAFITSERDTYADRPRAYTVRMWDYARGVNDLSSNGEFTTLAAAKRGLSRLTSNNN